MNNTTDSVLLYSETLDVQVPNDSLTTGNWSEPVVGCSNWKPSNHILLQTANSILLLGLLAPRWKHGVLFLHASFAIAFVLLSAWAWMILCAPDFFSWNFAFMIINIIQVLFLLYRIRPIKFHEDLEQLYTQMFQPMKVSRVLFKKLVSSDFCTLSTLGDGDAYAMQSVSKTDRLGLLISGTMKVYSHHTVLHLIHAREFIDSPEFESSITGEEKYQVSIIADGLCKYMYWSRQGFEYLLMKEPFLATVINTMMGRDITNKLYSLNDRVTANVGSRQDIRLPSVTAQQRRTSSDLRRTLAQVTSDSMQRSERRSTPLVNFSLDLAEENDRDNVEGRRGRTRHRRQEPYSLDEEQIDLLNGHVLPAAGRTARFSCSGNASPARSSASNVSGIHFNI